MSCCGKRINDAFGSRPAARPVSGARPPEATDSPLGGQRVQRAWGPVSTGFTPATVAPGPILRLVYEYAGRGAMTITSPATGRRYRFEHPGARQEVDRRDQLLMTQQASLRQVT